MKNTMHATTNYKALAKIIAAMNGSSHKRFELPEMLPLVIEKLYTCKRGTVYSLAHYGEQNGDLMRDPDMEIAINTEAGTAEPLSYQNDYLGIYHQVYIERDGKELYSPRMRTDLDAFLWQWLKNIKDQGYITA